MKRLHHHLRLSALALAAATCLPAALAAPVLSATSSAIADSVLGSTTVGSAPGYTASSSEANQPAGNGSGRSFSNSSGAYFVGSNAEGRAGGSAYASFLYTLTNTSGVAQLYTMNFHIYGGSIGGSIGTDASLTGSESLAASYSATVKVNGSLMFNSAASILRNAAGDSGSKTGVDLNAGDTADDGFYSWGGSDHSLELGILGAGDSMQILAEVQDMALADVGTYIYSGGCCNGYDYGYGCEGYNSFGVQSAVQADVCELFKGRADAAYGDPAGFGGTPVVPPTLTTFSAAAVNGVPEPGSLALSGLALLAASAAARRRRTA